MFEVAKSLLQFIKCSNCAFDQRLTVYGRLDALSVSVKQAKTNCAFQTGNQFRYGGLRNAKLCGGLAHAAALNDGQKNLQIPKPQASADVGFRRYFRHRHYL